MRLQDSLTDTSKHYLLITQQKHNCGWHGCNGVDGSGEKSQSFYPEHSVGERCGPHLQGAALLQDHGAELLARQGPDSSGKAQLL